MWHHYQGAELNHINFFDKLIKIFINFNQYHDTVDPAYQKLEKHESQKKFQAVGEILLKKKLNDFEFFVKLRFLNTCRG